MKNDKNISDIGSNNDICRICEKNKLKDSIIEIPDSLQNKIVKCLNNDDEIFQLINKKVNKSPYPLDNFFYKMKNYETLKSTKNKKLIFPCKCLLPVHERCLTIVIIFSQTLRCFTCDSYFRLEVPNEDLFSKLKNSSYQYAFYFLIFIFLIEFGLLILFLSNTIKFEYSFRFWIVIIIIIIIITLVIILLILVSLINKINQMHITDTIQIIDYQTNYINPDVINTIDFENTAKKKNSNIISANVFINFLRNKFNISFQDIFYYKSFKILKAQTLNSEIKIETTINILNENNKSFFGFSTKKDNQSDKNLNKMIESSKEISKTNHIPIQEKRLIMFNSPTKNECKYNIISSKDSIDYIHTEEKKLIDPWTSLNKKTSYNTDGNQVKSIKISPKISKKRQHGTKHNNNLIEKHKDKIEDLKFFDSKCHDCFVKFSSRPSNFKRRHSVKKTFSSKICSSSKTYKLSECTIVNNKKRSCSALVEVARNQKKLMEIESIYENNGGEVVKKMSSKFILSEHTKIMIQEMSNSNIFSSEKENSSISNKSAAKKLKIDSRNLQNSVCAQTSNFSNIPLSAKKRNSHPAKSLFKIN